MVLPSPTSSPPSFGPPSLWWFPRVLGGHPESVIISPSPVVFAPSLWWSHRVWCSPSTPVRLPESVVISPSLWWSLRLPWSPLVCGPLLVAVVPHESWTEPSSTFHFDCKGKRGTIKEPDGTFLERVVYNNKEGTLKNQGE